MIINKKHPDIAGHVNTESLFVSVKQNGFFFTSAAARRFGLIPGKYLHFINDGKDWSFFQNDDADGFLLVKDAKPNSSAVGVFSRPLTHMFRISTGFMGAERFGLVETNAKQKGFPVIEIMTAKTYTQLMKAV